ncbi:hypothetical protein CI1B_23530 [Bradyrhizobium ivorense]|uniref:Uncharacterized protein n=1 Tax=Bradyrhizobium ivorense TaxID=2511166 RepID=A0A508T6Z9_9BRAD|nr:hypothetical protein [Bradyrhizobium ivorense]VIO68778.1 hypothetical protein CI1B_23530 [Bradyrhizobium ivorense]
MKVVIPSELVALGQYLPRFLGLVGERLWFKRLDQLDAAQHRSPFNWKIISDYHWLEMAIGFQHDVLMKEGVLRPELVDELIVAALKFAASTVEIHARLSPLGQKNLEGRLRDCLKAETSYASLFLELDLAQRLMDAGFDVSFADMEGTGQFDLLFGKDSFVGEVECKSQSADAGRQIHRKDFYRFMEAILPALEVQRAACRREVLLITLDTRLSPSTSDQARLLTAVRSILADGARTSFAGGGFVLERLNFDAVVPDQSMSGPEALYKACGTAFGANTHISGGLTAEGGCLVVMRSKREDDTSKPLLEAMRKAASQLSGQRPGFIAIQDHGIAAADLMLPHVQRRAAILSLALYGRYGGSHVTATYVTAFGAVILRNGVLGTPAFAVLNPVPKFPLNPADASSLLALMSDETYTGSTEPLSSETISPGVRR